VCFDNCYPELSRCLITEYEAEESSNCEAYLYRQDAWEKGLRDELYSYAQDNNQSRVYEYFNDYHSLDHSEDICAPEWECEWEECDPNENGDACWMEICDSECDDEQICKTWYTYEYDCSKEEWLWDIQECKKFSDVNADYFEETAKDSADFMGENFEGSLALLQDLFCPEGACVNQSASMAANTTSMVLENSVPEVSW
jgi:hypothetical protein